MKKKGFTLVELLAVIAILAILVIIALPNIMGMFSNAKERLFLTEVKRIYRGAEQEYVKDAFNSSGKRIYSKCLDGCANEIDMQIRDDLEYYIEINGDGKVIKYYAHDNSYQYRYDGEMDVSDIKDAEDLSKVADADIVVISPTGASTGGWRLPEGKFRVIHSSDGSIEVFDVQDNFNIFALTKSGYYYGGYFQDYSLKGEMDDEGNYPNFQNFDGSFLDSWSYEKGYSEDGKNMKPVSRKTYFLREIPTTYLTSRIFFTGWGLNGSDPTIGGIWQVSTISDLAYSAAGFIMNGNYVNAGVHATFKITATDSGTSSTITIPNHFPNVKNGYIISGKFTDYMIDKSTYIGTPYYITKDNILVKARISYSVYFGNGNHKNDMVFKQIATPK